MGRPIARGVRRGGASFVVVAACVVSSLALLPTGHLIAEASPAATPPTITSTGGYLLYGKSTRRVLIHTTGYPKPTLTITPTIPAGTGFTFTGKSGGKGVFTGGPTTSAVGQHVYTITATNSAGSVTKTFTLTVARDPTFTTPSLQPFCPSTMTVGSYVRVHQRVADYPPFFGLTVTALPTGLQFAQNTTETSGILSGTPTTTDAGHHVLVYSADNTLTTKTKYRHCKVTVNEVPSFTVSMSSPSYASAVVGTHFSAPIIVTGNAGYPRKTLTVTTSVTAPGGSIKLPTGVFAHHHPGKTFGEVMNGMPKAGAAGDYLVDITAANAVGSTTEGFVLVVRAAGTSPKPASVSLTVPDPTLTYTGTEMLSAVVSGTHPGGYVQFFLTGAAAPVSEPVELTTGTDQYVAQYAVPADLSAGPYTVTAAYTGDPDNTTATTSATFKVDPATTSITLSTATGTAAPGAPAQYTAKVSSLYGTPVGAVTFSLNDKTVIKTLVASGIPDIATATLTTTSTTFGLDAAGSPYSVSAAYATFDNAPQDWAPANVTLTTPLVFGRTTLTAEVSTSPMSSTTVSNGGDVSVTQGTAFEIRMSVAAEKPGGDMPTGPATITIVRTRTTVTSMLVTPATLTAPSTDPDSSGGTGKDYWWAVPAGALAALPSGITSATVTLTYTGTGTYAPIAITFTLTW